MRILEVNEESLCEYLEKGELVLVNVYQEKGVITELMEGVLLQVQKNIDDLQIISISRSKIKNVLDEIFFTTPELLLYVKNHLVDRLVGLKKAAQIIDFVRQYS